jgi:transitional endoplasmic reticulum ATPase
VNSVHGPTTAQRLTLRVAEAQPSDAGRGLVRLAPVDIDLLALADGDVVAVEGKRLTTARLARGGDSTPEAGIAHIDGVMRENSGAGIGERVAIYPVACRAARSVTLAPSVSTATLLGFNDGGFFNRLRGKFRPGTVRPTQRDTPQIRRLLKGLSVTGGDRVRVNLFGRPLDFTVIATAPKDAVAIDAGTTIDIVGRPQGRQRAPAVSFEDIGGLSKEIARIREMIELPLRHPRLFEQLGIDPPRGVLLYGPPGSGKTLIARAVANECGVHFISVNGPEVIQQGYGESEARIRKIFEEAQQYPAAIIFFDEIDALAPNRDTVLGDVEKRVVAQLLSLMDGLRSRGKVIVIAATNLPNSVDPALRRAGRFDREIALSPPDKTGRLEILQVHTRGMPLAGNVDIHHVAAITHGFLGADLAALCREAAMLCGRSALLSIDSADGEISEANLAAIKVDMHHFESAINEVELSTTRQVFTEIPDVCWDDIGGLQDVKRVLRETIEWPLKYADRFEHVRTRPPKGVLLTGKPGTGKTLAAKAVGRESGVNFISVKGPELLSKWVGESERGIREIFKKARQAAPCVVFFDEIDAILPVRGNSAGGGANVTERMVGQFLLEMDSVEELHGVIVLGATNRIDLIDQGLLRPGRFDLIIELPIPDEPSRLAILTTLCRTRPLAADVSLPLLAQASSGFSGAELEALCRQAAMLAIRDSIASDPRKKFAAFCIERRHFDRALAATPRTPV